MSAWGISNFENDTALDWVNEVIHRKEVENFKESIDGFLKSFSLEETSLNDCSIFLTLAETIAALLGAPGQDFPEELQDWIETKYIKIESSTIDNAKKGVQLIMNGSEVREMYLDSGYFTPWEKTQKNLIKRLSE
ncbi:MAG: hypothetical protein CMD18_07130 [Flavobacteriales bacterium]|nr:hypothetical protein [Flavobacteriales bacterium]